MGYTNEEKINIGRIVVTHELSRKEALLKYDISHATLDKYVRLYRVSIGEIANKSDSSKIEQMKVQKRVSSSSPDMEAYMAMSKEELINELIKAKANELRAKKGYEVKGDGANKEFVSLNKWNTK